MCRLAQDIIYRLTQGTICRVPCTGSYGTLGEPLYNALGEPVYGTLGKPVYDTLGESPGYHIQARQKYMVSGCHMQASGHHLILCNLSLKTLKFILIRVSVFNRKNELCIIHKHKNK